MKVLYLDESGTHNITSPEQDYPVFVLGGVIMGKDYAEGAATNRLNDLKRELFGTTDITLHTADITRNRNGFERLTDKGFRKVFYTALNKVMAELDYEIIACAIDRNNYAALYKTYKIDPYHLSLRILIEKFCEDIGDVHAGGLIMAERRDEMLDRQLENVWESLLISGTKKCKAKNINKRLTGLHLIAKADRLAGLELADLIASPIGRHLLGKPEHKDWDIVKSKFKRNEDDDYNGVGLTTLP